MRSVNIMTYTTTRHFCTVVTSDGTQYCTLYATDLLRLAYRNARSCALNSGARAANSPRPTQQHPIVRQYRVSAWFLWAVYSTVLRILANSVARLAAPCGTAQCQSLCRC